MSTTNVTDAELAEVARLDHLATKGPYRVNRYDCDGGAINWQVQQDDGANGDEVIANISDDETTRAKHDAAFFALMRMLGPRIAHDLATLRDLVREFEVASKGHKATTAAAIADRMFAAVKP